MFKHSKFTAFIMSLLVCAAAIAPQTASVYADNETETSVSDPAEDSDITTENNDYIVSGDFSYSVTELGSVCIEGYTGTDSELVIPGSIDGKEVTRINKYALENCHAVSIHFPATITYISGENPFLQCTELKEITVDEENENYTAADGILYSKDKLELLCYPQAKEDDSFKIPDGVETIGTAAFYQTSLRELALPSSLTTVKRHGFSSNEVLASVDMSGTAITSIGDMAFSYCTALSDVKFPESLLEIGSGAFAGCTALNEITLPEALTTIGQNAFAATGLTEVTIPATVTNIGYCAFGYDENLEPLESFVIIGEANSAAQVYATDTDEDYEYANNFTFKTVSQAETELEELESMEYGDFLYAEVDGEAYITGCISIDTTIEVPSEINGLPVTCIYGGAFFQSGARSIILPDTLKSIEQIAFYMCSELTSITIPDGVTAISNNAFDSCISLETVTIPGTCETIGDEIFYGCSSLKEISVSGAEGGNYLSENGILYNKDKTILVAYPAAKEGKSFKVPSGVKEIAVSAFCDCTALEKVDISSVSIIGAYAFENCTSLKSVKFSKNIESIDVCAFYGCTALVSVRLWNAPSIGAYALGFYYDSNNSTDAVIDGFKIYADENSDGYNYAQMCGIECITNTYYILGFNVVKGFVYTISGILAAAVLAVIGFIIGKNVKKKKAAQADASAVKKSDKGKTEKTENAPGKDDNNEAE